jgi:hypothetical protein
MDPHNSRRDIQAVYEARKRKKGNCCFEMVRGEGIEPPTFAL